MLAEILTIGDELCRGEIADTNSSWLAQNLWDLDVTVGWMTSCRDVEADIQEALTQATARADIVLVSGGLGPTDDDLTVDVISRMLGVEPVIDDAARDRMQQRFRAARFKMTPNNFRQVQVPHGALVLGNPVGSAPGFEVVLNRTPVLCMPGVPAEMKSIFETAIQPRVIALRESRGENVERIARRIYRVFGMGESHVATALDGLVADVAGASLHYQVKFPEVLVKIVVRDRDRDAACQRLASIDAEIRSRLGRHKMYGVDDDSLAAALGRALAGASATMATAESCTGGLVGALMTEVPGSSAHYVGGAITYTNEEKIRQLGVREATLEAHGAVSEACVIEMARGARDRFATTYAVAVSGVAGPGGGTPEKPVGTVWLAVAGPGDTTTTRLLQWPGNRKRIRRLSAFWAMSMVLGALAKETTDGQ